MAFYLVQKLCALAVRALFNVRSGLYQMQPSSRIDIPSRDSGRSIKINIYEPPVKAASPSPVLINFHGSGFILPMHGSDDLYCRRVAEQTPYTVLDVAYRLAPENPWPSAHHDAQDVVQWVLQQPARFNVDNIAISGFSAGAQMACVASAVTFPRDTFSALIAFYPATDLSIPASEKFAPDTSGSPMPGWLTTIFEGCYLPGEHNKRDPTISPIYAKAMNYPREVLIVTAACDIMCTEGERLYSKISEEKDHHVVLYRAEKCDHAWDKDVQRGSIQEEARDHAYGMAIDMLQEALGK